LNDANSYIPKKYNPVKRNVLLSRVFIVKINEHLLSDRGFWGPGIFRDDFVAKINKPITGFMKNKLAIPALSSCGGQEDILAPPLDFESCVNMLGGDRAMVQELIRDFLGHLDLQVTAIAAALAEANAEVVAQVAHSIKGGAAVLSAHSLMNAAGVLEEFGKSGDLLNGEDCLLLVEKEVARLRSYCMALTGSDT